MYAVDGHPISPSSGPGNQTSVTQSQPSDICQTCWTQPFANHFGLLGPPMLVESPGGHKLKTLEGGFVYRTRMSDIKAQAKLGCRWCKVLANTSELYESEEESDNNDDDSDGDNDDDDNDDDDSDDDDRDSDDSDSDDNNDDDDHNDYDHNDDDHDDDHEEEVDKWTRLRAASDRRPPISMAQTKDEQADLEVDLPEAQDKNEETVEIRMGIERSEEGERFNVWINDDRLWERHMYTREDDPTAAYVRGRSVYREVGSERALSLAMELMQDCLRHHECPSLPDPCPRMPTRVIDCSCPYRPRLFVSGDTRGRYVALSYVWGERQLHSTTKENIDSYSQCMDTVTLPQTILDAIQTTHRLGVRFLWVDSLCIIQDSDEDKYRELARMRDVYRNAYLTIVAASAHRVGEGFLQTRSNRLECHVTTLPFVLPSGGGVGSISFYDVTKFYPRRDTYIPEHEPTHRRGWCMQEYFLSPRALLFSSHTLQYRCRKLVSNIGGSQDDVWTSPVYADQPCIERSSVHDGYPLWKLPRPVTSSDDATTAFETWRGLVRNYSRRKVSVPTDKLNALAALAEEFHDIIQSPYRAGLWESTLLADLLWSRKRDNSFCLYSKMGLPPPRPYSAPSWSWAAIENEVDPSASVDKDVTFLAECVRCNTTLRDEKVPFGAVTAGVLVLRAPALECAITSYGQIFYLGDQGGVPDLQGTTVLDQATEEKRPGESEAWTGDQACDNEYSLKFDRNGKPRKKIIGFGNFDRGYEILDDSPQRVSVVLVYRHVTDPQRANSGFEEVVIRGLVLESIGSGCPGNERTGKQYRRIGHFQSDADADIDDWLRHIPHLEVEIV